MAYHFLTDSTALEEGIFYHGSTKINIQMESGAAMKAPKCGWEVWARCLSVWEGNQMAKDVDGEVGNGVGYTERLSVYPTTT